MVPRGQSHRRPCDSRFDHHPYPQGTRMFEFAKFSGDQGKSTREHIGQFLAQLGELADTEAFCVRLFSLSLTGTAFAWYATLRPNSILSWGDLEQKFCNTPSNPWTGGTYSLQLSRIIYRPHRPTRVFCAHFVHTHAHPRKLPGRSPIPNCSKPSTLNLEVLSRQASKKKMHLVDMITLLVLLSLGPGYPILGARISQSTPLRRPTSSSVNPNPGTSPLSHVCV
jgi:hypothetical protein